MSDDGMVYVASKADWDCSLICGVYTTLDGAIDCLDRLDDRKEWNDLRVYRIPLDCDFDELGSEPVYRVDPRLQKP